MLNSNGQPTFYRQYYITIGVICMCIALKYEEATRAYSSFVAASTDYQSSLQRFYSYILLRLLHVLMLNTRVLFTKRHHHKLKTTKLFKNRTPHDHHGQVFIPIRKKRQQKH